MIQATTNDVLLSGHGAVIIEQGETVVPEGVTLVVLSPPGASVANSLASDLENGKAINQLAIISPNSGKKSPTQPIIYNAGERAPNYVLAPIDGSWLKPGVAHIVGVSQPTPLSDLWLRVMPLVGKNKHINCFWAACTALNGATNPVVVEA